MDARDATMTLLAARSAGATVCPSEVARAMAAADGAGGAVVDWRSKMPKVHAAIDQMVAEGVVRLSWKGEVLKTRAGPYRIGRGVP